MKKTDLVIPERVNICGIVYEIEIVPEVVCNGESAYGMCDEGTCVIKVKEGMNKYRLKEVLLHEIIHGISNETAIDLNETQVHNLAIQLLDVINRNELLGKILVR